MKQTLEQGKQSRFTAGVATSQTTEQLPSEQKGECGTAGASTSGRGGGLLIALRCVEIGAVLRILNRSCFRAQPLR